MTGTAELHNSPNLFSGHRSGHPVDILRRVEGPDHTITSIRFDYVRGTATRTEINRNSGKVLRSQNLPGRPQSSRREFLEAISIITRDTKLGGLLLSGAVPEGGFIVDGPPDHPAKDRYIQIRLLSQDRVELLRVVLVDLSEGTVASARRSFE
jgi:hypothetical protein